MHMLASCSTTSNASRDSCVKDIELAHLEQRVAPHAHVALQVPESANLHVRLFLVHLLGEYMLLSGGCMPAVGKSGAAPTRGVCQYQQGRMLEGQFGTFDISCRARRLQPSSSSAAAADQSSASSCNAEQ